MGKKWGCGVFDRAGPGERRNTGERSQPHRHFDPERMRPAFGRQPRSQRARFGRSVTERAGQFPPGNEARRSTQPQLEIQRHREQETDRLLIDGVFRGDADAVVDAEVAAPRTRGNSVALVDHALEAEEVANVELKRRPVCSRARPAFLRAHGVAAVLCVVEVAALPPTQLTQTAPRSACRRR